MLGPFTFTFTFESEEFEKFEKVGAAAAADLYQPMINTRAPDGANKKILQILSFYFSNCMFFVKFSLRGLTFLLADGVYVCVKTNMEIFQKSFVSGRHRHPVLSFIDITAICPSPLSPFLHCQQQPCTFMLTLKKKYSSHPSIASIQKVSQKT